MFGHRRCQIAIVGGGKIDGTECECHDIVLYRDVVVV